MPKGPPRLQLLLNVSCEPRLPCIGLGILTKHQNEQVRAIQGININQIGRRK